MYGKNDNFSSEAALVVLIASWMANDREKIGELLNSEQIDWVKLKNLVAYHELAPFAYLALKEFDLLLPRELYALLRNSYYYDLARCQRLWQEFLGIAAAFKRAQIIILPIKGIALLEDLYVQYPVRPMVDIDLLVKEKEIQAAEKILNDLGYKKELCGCEEKYWREKQIHFAFQKKEGKTSFLIELHWMLDFKRKNRFVLPELWERTKTIKVDGMEIRVLSPEDTLFSLALHSRRFGKALCLKNVRDAVLLLNKYADNFDWNYCLKMSEKYELSQVLFFMLCQIRLLSDKHIPKRVWKGLRVSKFKRMVIRWFIEKNTFFPHMDKRGKSLYLTSHFLLYDTFWEPVVYIFNIPKEQFAKYYGLSPYDRKTERAYCFRLFYIPFRQIAACFKRGGQFKEIKPELSEEKKEVKDLAVVQAWGWSMYPNIRDGDMVILKKKKPRMGDVICFKNGTGKDVMHRVIRLNKEYIFTKGDNSLNLDRPVKDSGCSTKVGIAVKKGSKLNPIKGKWLYGYFYFLGNLIILCRRLLKNAILFFQELKIYPKMAKRLFGAEHIDIAETVEADDFYFIQARINDAEAGSIKIDKKTFSILYLYVKIIYRKLGIEQRLIEKCRELENRGNI